MGALVNGPQKPDDIYDDVRRLANSRVSISYNAAFTSAPTTVRRRLPWHGDVLLGMCSRKNDLTSGVHLSCEA